MRRYPQVGFSAARRSASRRSSADVDGRPGGRCGWVQCRAMRRRCHRNSVSGVTSHPARLGRGSAAAIAASKVRSVSVSSGRSTWRRNTASWWRNTIISRFFERPDRTVSRASDANNRYKIRYTTNQHRPASRQVNDHGRVSGTHTTSVVAVTGPQYDPRVMDHQMAYPGRSDVASARLRRATASGGCHHRSVRRGPATTRPRSRRRPPDQGAVNSRRLPRAD